jgi:hypothetical protein
MPLLICGNTEGLDVYAGISRASHPGSLSERRQTAVFSLTWAAWLAYEAWPLPHLVAKMGLTINALPHTFVLTDKLPEGIV